MDKHAAEIHKLGNLVSPQVVLPYSRSGGLKVELNIRLELY